MRILIVSNQHADNASLGNPILYRIMCSMRKDNRVEKADFAYFDKSHPIQSLRTIAAEVRNHDIAHVHFGGLYALAVWFAMLGAHCPKLITFHGTDIHAKAIKTAKGFAEKAKIRLNQWASFACILLYKRHGYVAKQLLEYVPRILRQIRAKREFIQPLGVDYSLFVPTDPRQMREKLGIGKGTQVLFSDVSNSNVKRRDLAEQIVDRLPADFHLLVMSGVKPDMVPSFINACDMLLLTSDEEGSPNIIRECLALNKRVYSVDVGDARQQLDGLANSTVISRDPDVAARQIIESLKSAYTDNSRETRQAVIDLDHITGKMINYYAKLTKA